jgi:hypothetical protein
MGGLIWNESDQLGLTDKALFDLAGFLIIICKKDEQLELRSKKACLVHVQIHKISVRN